MSRIIPIKTLNIRRRNRSARVSLWSLGGRSLKQVAGYTWERVLEDDLTGRSAQLSYYFFLSLFPGLIFVSSLIGIVAGSHTHLRDHLLDSFGTFLPPAAYTLVVSTFTEVLQSSTAGKALLGVIFAFWSATSGLSAVQDTLNGVCRVKETRPLWKSTLVSMILTVVVVTLGMVALVAFFYGGNLVEFISAEIGLSAGLTFLWKLVQWPIAVFLLSLTFAVVYYYAPNVKRVDWRWITPGSAVGILGWLGVSAIFRAYLHYFNHYSVTYGSLGAVIILLLWFYLTGFMLLLGAEVNSVIYQVTDGGGAAAPGGAHLPVPPADKKASAVSTSSVQ